MSDLGTFEIDIQRFVDKAKGNLALVVRYVALDLFSRIIAKSPVSTGRFKGNWQVAIGSVPAGTLEICDKDGSATIERAQAAMLGLKAGDVVYLVNNLPYANRLEFGWSKQAPSGMVRTTILEYGGIVSDAVAEVQS